MTTDKRSGGQSFPDRLLAALLRAVGAFIAGIGADLVGPRTMTLIFSGIIVAIAVIVYLASPIVREYRLSQALEGESQ